MKKMWLAIMLAAALVCWGGSAMAARIVGADTYCFECENTSVFIDDCGDYHYAHCEASGCGYELTSKHIVDCEDLTKCSVCGNTTNLSDAEIKHTQKWKKIKNWRGETVQVTDYTSDEYMHRVDCWCGEKCWEEYHYVSCYNDPKAKECGICHKENPIISNEHKQHYFAGDDGSCWCGYNPNQRYPGDANNTSSVTLADVRVILSGNVSSESNADVNADGNVNEKDVLRIMQYLAGWDVTLE